MGPEMPERKTVDNVSVDYDHFDWSLVIRVWSKDHDQQSSEVRIAVEDIPSFLREVVGQGTYALSSAALRLEVGHCETCGNTGLVDTDRHGRPWTEDCPDCRPRWPNMPFAGAPTIGRRAPRGDSDD